MAGRPAATAQSASSGPECDAAGSSISDAADHLYFRGPANQGWQPVRQPTVQAPYAAPDWSVCRTLLDTQERKHRRKLFRSSCNQIGWTILSCLLLLTAIISMLTTVVLVFHLYPAGMGAGAWMETASFFFIESIAYILAFLIPTLLLLLLKRVPMSSVFPSKRVSFPVAAATVAIGFGICILANFPAAWITAIFQRFGLSQEMPGYEVNQDILAQVLFFIGVAVIPPLVEEFLFRGLFCTCCVGEGMALPSFFPRPFCFASR
ncbi:MAG: hypothetical protein ACLSB9_20375 [Hydrogeniiclostridium mannosilyticum]